MPRMINGANRGEFINERPKEGLLSANYNYEYPEGLDLKPGSPLHRRLLGRLKTMAYDSRESMTRNYTRWEEIDKTLTAYIEADELEKDVKELDPRRPISIVVPTSHAIMETILAYIVKAWLSDPIFAYEGFGPEDVNGVMLLEQLIKMQTLKGGAVLGLHTMWRDSLAHGIGVATPLWEERRGIISVLRPQREWNFTTMEFEDSEPVRDLEEGIIFEGNTIANVDTYSYLPDPTVSVHDVQKGEHVGWISRENRLRLLERERYDKSVFNVKYLKHLQDSGQSSLWYTPGNRTNRTDRFGSTYNQVEKVSQNTMDVISQYVNIVPHEWGLGDKETPEKWIFALAADAVIIQAGPVDLRHGMFPVVVNAPEYDGHSPSPISKMETIYGLQEVQNWFLNSHVTNIRKAMNDMLVVDPMWVNILDLEEPGPGKLIRTMPGAWGRGVKGAVEQLMVHDVTRGNVADSANIGDIMQMVSAATDSVQGVQRHSSERVSATEFQNTQAGAVNRLEKMGVIGWFQSMLPLATMFASQTQQFMSEETYVNIAGRNEESLRKIFGINSNKVLVSPMDINVPFDVMPHQGKGMGGENAQTWLEIFRMISSNPTLMQRFDVTGIASYLFTLLGARNMHDFLIEGGDVNMRIANDEEIMRESEKGNIVPLDTQRGL